MLYSHRADRDHLATLMSLIDWTPSAAADDVSATGSCCPDQLYDVLDFERWSMLENGLIDWDIMEGRKTGSPDDAAYRLGAIYVPAIFEGAAPAVDHVLGELIDCRESDTAATALGHRWREDLCATSWRMRLTDRAAEREPGGTQNPQ